MTMGAAEWHKLPISLTELCINTTLRCGQSFRWRKSTQDEWSCALHGRILSFRQDAKHLHYRAIFPSQGILPTPPPSVAPSPAHASNRDSDDTLALIHHYFNLTPNLSALYAQWSASDPNFQKLAPKFTGVRILRQDAWEALIGFICSSNNHISRISGMVQNICIHYGPFIANLDSVPYHDFPTPQALAQDGVEANLVKLGFGYRAKYISKTARMVEQRGMTWLEGLCNPETPGFGVEEMKGAAGDMAPEGREGYRRAHGELLALHGVGPKVADCVCLFGLGWGESVPVDTHVHQIAQRAYHFTKSKHKSLTTTTYNAVANHFRLLWGVDAGWAHSVLFTADLKSFAGQLAAEVEVVREDVAVKLEDGVLEEKEIATKTKKVTKKNTKRAADGTPVVAVKKEAMVTRRSKRRRT
ncbi:putative DNA N-glycosylase [Pleomassaria siparia CBS 279.74]|uniref:DNA-(apurinic or apyrimidinic site) lyase n=1 Tax=Pleomassaria siparia CBS 279.74 TaxID=1314801 RepID=A0A6G1JX35_9PLEO|nr:putative DNA N-glycosylase [Pleomassaria siparia CBS 279.74]